jgi:hypothetical protein
MIYSGWGILAVAIYGIVFFAFWATTGYLTNDHKYFFNNILLSIFSFAVSGGAVWFIGRWMNKLNPLQILEFVEGERQVISKPRHTIYTVEMEYWGIIFFFLSVIIFSAKKFGLL